MIDLTPFCSSDHSVSQSNRYFLSIPWIKDGYQWASDGVIIVRVRTDQPDSELQPLFPENSFQVLKPYDKTLIENMKFELPVQIVEKVTKQCSQCKGLGEITEEECTNCHGSGECECGNCGWEHDCGYCGGTGRETPHPDEVLEDGKMCSECNGDGSLDNSVVEHHGQFIAGKYYNMIKDLPDVLLQVVPEEDILTSTPVYFSFEGGEGLVMPRRRDA